MARYPGPPDTASYVTASSADGRLLVGHSVNGQAAWDLEAGELLWTRPPDTQCNALVVADAVGAVLCGSEEGRVWAYDLATGARTEGPFDYQFGPVRSLTLADGGAQLIEAGGSAVAFWRLDGGGASARVLVPGDAVPQAYDSDGNLVVTRHRTGPNPDWDLVDGNDGHLLDPFDDMTGVVPIEPGVFAATFADGSPGWYDSRRRVRVPPTGDGLGFAPSGAQSTTESLVVWGEDIQVFDRERNHAAPQVPVEDNRGPDRQPRRQQDLHGRRHLGLDRHRARCPQPDRWAPSGRPRARRGRGGHHLRPRRGRHRRLPPPGAGRGDARALGP